MKFNHYQKAALKHYLQTSQSLAIQALAGTGKTTFIQGTTKVLKYPGDSTIITFTNSSKNDLIKRIPDFEKQIKTTYSLGFTTLLKEFGDLKVDGLKTYNQLKEHEKEIETFLFSLNGFPVKKEIKKAAIKEIVNLYNLALLNLYTTKDDIVKLCPNLLSVCGQNDDFNDFKSTLVEQLVIQNTQAPPTSLTFSEMVALPSYFNIQLNKVKEILVDEAQDLSKAQQQLIKQTAYTNSQLILVGDENQAIFGFAGSDNNSFSNLIKMFDCKVFPMPINYRCGTEIIKYANKIYGGLESPTTMHKGKVKELTYSEAFTVLQDNKNPTLVISRTFKTLVQLGLELLKQNIKFSFSKNALQEKLVTQINCYQNRHPFNMLADILEDDIIKATDKNHVYLYTILETLEYFLNTKKHTSYAQLKRTIDIFFNYSKHDSNLVLSTIHSAKGLEAHTVVHLGYNLLPHKLSQTEEQLQQEKNLDYVARTRAKHNLYLVEVTT